MKGYGSTLIITVSRILDLSVFFTLTNQVPREVAGKCLDFVTCRSTALISRAIFASSNSNFTEKKSLGAPVSLAQ